jgi:hypothetical protein
MIDTKIEPASPIPLKRRRTCVPNAAELLLVPLGRWYARRGTRGRQRITLRDHFSESNGSSVGSFADRQQKRCAQRFQLIEFNGQPNLVLLAHEV